MIPNTQTKTRTNWKKEAELTRQQLILAQRRICILEDNIHSNKGIYNRASETIKDLQSKVAEHQGVIRSITREYTTAVRDLRGESKQTETEQKQAEKEISALKNKVADQQDVIRSISILSGVIRSISILSETELSSK